MTLKGSMLWRLEDWAKTNGNDPAIHDRNADDGCVTQASIVENKLLSGALTEIRKRQQQREQELVHSAKTKREKRIVRDRFADRVPPPGP